MLSPGDHVGEWIVEEPLGEGGMGAVYRAHSAGSTRVKAAVKVLKPSAEPEAAARFVREAEALSALSHPSIVRVMGFSTDRERNLAYLVMELAAGETLKARMQRGAMSLPEAIGVFLPLASALEHAHQSGIWHRDLKPANIVLSPDGTVKLVDFGIATGQDWVSLTSSGHMGTPAYLPPEAFRGERADPPKADVYGLGLLLFESLSGTRPFASSSAGHAASANIGMRKLQQEALDPGPAFPAELRELVRGATNPIQAERPTMKAVREGLEAVIGGSTLPLVAEDRTTRVPEPEQHTGPLVIPLPPRPVRRGPLAGVSRGVLAAIVVPAVIGLILLVVYLSRRSPQPTGASSTAARAGDPVRTNAKRARDGLDYIEVPAGSFEMGCAAGAGCMPSELPRHPVSIGKPFWMTRTEVTVSAFRLFLQSKGHPMPEAPPFNPDWSHGDHPMVLVGWEAAREYCGWLGGRLPSEAELEYAARAGSGATFPWGEDAPVCDEAAPNGARFGRCDGQGTGRVAAYGPNAFGLHDMSGNVWEWAADEWHDTLDGAPGDGSSWGTALGKDRVVIRGGGWNSDGGGLRSSIRDWVDATTTGQATGFRCVVDDAPR